MCGIRPSARTACSAAAATRSGAPERAPGSFSNATRARPGTSSFRSSARLVIRSASWNAMPVTLPPGRAKLAMKPEPTGITYDGSDDGDRCSPLTECTDHTRAIDDDDLGLHRDNIINDHRQPLVLALSEPFRDCDVAAFNPTERTQPVAELAPIRLRHRRTDKTDDGNARRTVDTAGGAWRDLLPARRERPRRSRANEKRDELAPLHSITSSARASSIGGISMPSALAVLRFTTSSKRVGCSTGSSAGLAPLIILSTYTAARRHREGTFTP